MELKAKKISILVIICICIVMLESVIGFATFYAGILYRGYNRDEAEEMLELVKKTDINYYQKLIDPEDDSYLKEFEEIHTQKGNPLLIFYGLISILFSFGCLIPLVMIIFTIQKEEEPEPEENSKRDEITEEEKSTGESEKEDEESF